MTRFDPKVTEPDPDRRSHLLTLLEAALEGVDAERTTAAAMAGRYDEPVVVIAIGKAAPAMSRGAAAVSNVVGGVCVADHPEPVPPGVELIIGDHPVPGLRSLDAAGRVLEIATSTPAATRLVALVSGGGSALCEMPRPGISTEDLAATHRRLMERGVDITDINLVRGHLSTVKCGGVSRAAGRAIDTYIVSDVHGGQPWLVSSGPTIPHRGDPQAALEVLRAADIDVPGAWLAAVSEPRPAQPDPAITVVADGFDAVAALAAASAQPVEVRGEWLTGDLTACLDRFLATSGPGITVAVGEPTLEVSGSGRGGRNTHAALLAATRIAGSDDVFVAFASDGVDGNSGAAGAIVDGATLSRGGDPRPALEDFDSAGYLADSSDLLVCGPTGTNVSDIWVLWRRSPT